MRRVRRIAGFVLCLGGLLPVACAGAGSAPVTPATVRPSASRPVAASTTLRGLDSAQRRTDGALVVRQRLSGTGTLQAGHVIIEGTLAPGNSPGCIDFGGNVTFNATASLQIELGGLTPCTEYDHITVAGQLTLNGPVLQLSLYNGFVPAWGDRFDILDWGSLSGSFAGLDTSAAVLPVPLVWDTSSLYTSGEVVVGVQHIGDGDLAPWNSPDGVINAADVLVASQLVTGVRSPGALQMAHGDMDGDGDIDSGDLLQIVRAVLF